MDGTNPFLTIEALEVIDDAEKVWQEAVAAVEHGRRINRPWLLALREELILDVGGPDALASLDADPLPVDEPVPLDGLDADTAALVLRITELTDRALRFPSLHQLRTATRRFVALLAREAPKALRGPTVPNLAAAACWVVVHGNVDAPRNVYNLQTAGLASAVRASASGVPARGRKLLDALGIEQPPPNPGLAPSAQRKLLRLGHAELLAGSRRRDILEQLEKIAWRLGEA
jgi:hypothetical protein